MRINKFNKILAVLFILGSSLSLCLGQIYRDSVSVLAVENRFALVQLGFDISDALDMEYIVFDSTSSDFANNIVYVWNDGINDWVKTTMSAFLSGSLFYNKNVKDVLVITDSLNSIQKFGENATWASEMFVIDKLEYPSILNSINNKYKFTAPQWNVFSEKYSVKVENVATDKSRYTQPLWDFSLPSFTVEPRENSANANLTPKDIQNSSVEVVIVDTEFLSSTDVETSDVNEIVVVEDSTVVVFNSKEVITTNMTETAVEVPVDETIVEPVVPDVEIVPVATVVDNQPVEIAEITEDVSVEVAEITEDVSVEVAEVVEVDETNLVSAISVSSPVVKPVAAPVVQEVEAPVVEDVKAPVVENIDSEPMVEVVVEEQEEVIKKPIAPAPELDDEDVNVQQIKVEL